MKKNSGLCPLCGKDNGCAFNTGRDPSTCWCMKTKIPSELRVLSKDLGGGESCICKDCVEKFRRGEFITKK